MGDDASDVRKGQGSTHIDKAEFARRFRQRFHDPAFDAAAPEIGRLIDVAWEAYDGYRKAPRTRKAGPGFADPDYELSVDWLAARDAIAAAEQRHRDPAAPLRILVICGSPRSDQTCPGEMSKTFRLIQLAREIVRGSRLRGRPARPQPPHLGVRTRHLSLQGLRLDRHAAVPLALLLLSEPRHRPGQRLDERDLSALGRGARRHDRRRRSTGTRRRASLKLMIDRLVCADGGNPDPTTTGGKDPAKAKALELKGWHYPRHLAGRAFAVVVHGDAAGARERCAARSPTG